MCHVLHVGAVAPAYIATRAPIANLHGHNSQQGYQPLRMNASVEEIGLFHVEYKTYTPID
jgi:hypothetical protein